MTYKYYQELCKYLSDGLLNLYEIDRGNKKFFIIYPSNLVCKKLDLISYSDFVCFGAQKIKTERLRDEVIDANIEDN